jgi:glutamate-ammonia-ligase adenylyltransferase
VVRGEALSQSKKIPMMLEELQRQLAGTPGDWESAAAVARRYQRAELVRIALADILGLADVEWTQAEMSFLAEAQLRFAFDACAREIQPPVPPLAVIALGKFGGQELGYGADLDVLFVTNDDAESAMSAARLANRLIEFMSKQTADGSIFKLDARLRPDGEQGPLVPSLTACRRYYGKRAWLWEKQSLLKARFVAGETKTGRAFMGLVNETVFSRPLTDDERQEILAMRRRIEQERSDRAQPELSFKTTAGGMMDVEFLVQTLQLRHGHEMESLRCAPTLAALGRLTARGLVEESDNYTLRHDYLFLRRVESALRRHENSPVSSLLPDETEQQKLAKRLGFSSREEFWKTYETVRRRIRNIYEKLMK